MNELLRRILFLPPQSSTVASSIDHLHYFVILSTMGGATAITLIGGWFLIKYRRRPHEGEPPRQADAPRVPGWLEALVVSGLLGLFCLWWVIGFLQFIRVRVAPKDTLDIYVSAKQWMWEFSYSDGNHTLGVVYVPSGRAVKLIMSSRDVIHSFYVADFRLKEDVVPGRYTTLWFQADQPGTHQILCAEFCGTGHSRMRGQVVVLDPTDYSRWLGGAIKPEELSRAGVEAAAGHGCLRCHTLDGTPHIGPTWAGLFRSTVPLKGGGSVVADEEYLTESMMEPQVKIRAGFPPVMPSYHGLLGAADTAAIVELIKSLRDVSPRPQPPPEPPPQGPLRVTPLSGEE